MRYSQVSRTTDGVIVRWNLIDIKNTFKKRDIDGGFNSSVYRVISPEGIVTYYGEGVYFFGRSIEYNIKHMRATTHRNDTLSNTLCEGWIIEILAIGISELEARILEAKLIRDDKKPLSKRGIYEWDGKSLMNKRRERKYENMINEYIYGDNPGIAA